MNRWNRILAALLVLMLIGFSAAAELAFEGGEAVVEGELAFVDVDDASKGNLADGELALDLSECAPGGDAEEALSPLDAARAEPDGEAVGNYISGECGDDVKWKRDDDKGVLTIYGTGRCGIISMPALRFTITRV